jgi:hypothetical protein
MQNNTQAFNNYRKRPLICIQYTVRRHAKALTEQIWKMERLESCTKNTLK